MWERCGQEWLAYRKMRSSQATRLRGVWSCGRGVARSGWPVHRKMRSSQATRLRGVWSCGRGVARKGWPVGR